MEGIYEYRSVQVWLYVCAGCVFCMMLIGAITRLTESGLSMVEWKPLIGVIPPLNDNEWYRVFEAYKNTPEFQKKNFWMELPDFKRIFFWEWFHRLWGRSIGLIYALPLLWFWLSKKIPIGYGKRFVFLLLLGGAQGLMGWYMVQSGLVDRPSVSHFRLAAHLFLAFLIYGGLLWTGLSLNKQKTACVQVSKAFKIHLVLTLLFFVFVMLWGAMTAGLDAGLIYGDEFPTMGGQMFPVEVRGVSDILNQPVGVQFMHRWLAMSFALFVFFLWLHSRKTNARSKALHGLTIMVVLQIALGIGTLFSGIDVLIAVLHQAGALIILSLLIIALSQICKSSSNVTGT